MGTKRPTNEKIHIGDIYVYYSRDECGSSCAFYQVVGKRAKTLVELRPIQGEWFVDETCDSAVWEVKVRPLPGYDDESDRWSYEVPSTYELTTIPNVRW